MYVTDLRHFDGVELDPQAPRPAQLLASYLGRIVCAATATREVGAWATALPCRRRPGHRACPGRLLVQRRDIPAEIRWECPSCGEEGVISGWQESLHDLSSAARADSLPHVTAVVPESGYRLMLDELLPDREGERILYAARPVAHGVELSGSEDDLEELAGFIAFEANHASSRERRGRWDDLLSILEAALRRG